ncbi:MAG: hypothetical protein GY757_06800 [bacterium]|nr:hypothetical protein [bacterium]
MKIHDSILVKKIPDGKLQQFVLSDEQNKMPVLVEVETGEPVVEMAPRPATLRDVKVMRPVFVNCSNENKKAEKEAVEKTRALLNTLEIKNKFLSSSRVFIIEATPPQLLQIIKLPTVRKIIPNRTVKM